MIRGKKIDDLDNFVKGYEGNDIIITCYSRQTGEVCVFPLEKQTHTHNPPICNAFSLISNSQTFLVLAIRIIIS